MAGITELSDADLAGMVPIGQQSAGPKELTDADLAGMQPMQPVADAKSAFSDGSHPDSALNQSPVGIWDRFKMQLGDRTGPESVKLLKSKFEDAQVNSLGKLVVKDNGNWHRVSEDTTKDVYGNSRKLFANVMKDAGQPLTAEMTQDMSFADFQKKVASTYGMGNVNTAAKLAEAVPSMVTSAATAAKFGPTAALAAGLSPLVLEPYQDDVSKYIGEHKVLATTAAAVGTVGAAASMGPLGAARLFAATAWNAGLSEAGRTILGRFVGTATEDIGQNMKDIGTDSFLAAGGVVIGAGIMPSMKGLVTAGKYIKGNAAKDAGELVANSLEKVNGNITPGSVSKFIERPDEVGKHWARMEASSVSDPKAILQAENVDLMTKWAPKVQKSLSTLRNDMANATIQTADDSFTHSGQSMGKDIYSALEQRGIGRFDPKDGSFVMATKDELRAAAESASTAGNLKAANTATELATNPNAQKYLDKLQNHIDELYDSTRELKGKAGATQLLADTRAFNKNIDALLKTASDDNFFALNETVGAAKDAARNYTTMKFQKPTMTPAENPYTMMQETYKKLKGDLGDILYVGKKISDSDRTVTAEATVNKLLSATGKNGKIKSQFDQAIDLLAARGEPGLTNIKQEMIDRSVAKELYNTMPESVWRPSARMTAKIAESASRNIKGVAGLPGEAASAIADKTGLNAVANNPQVKIAYKAALDSAAFLKEMALKNQTSKILTDPAKVSQIFSIGSASLAHASQVNQQAMQQAQQFTRPNIYQPQIPPPKGQKR